MCTETEDLQRIFYSQTSLKTGGLPLHVSLDTLVFDEDERGPSDDMRLQFEAVSQLPEEERKIVKALIEGMVIKYQARRMVENLSS